MKYLNLLLIIIVFLLFFQAGFSQGKNVLSIKGTCFEINKKPFEFTGVSFFNAIYNVEFNKRSMDRQTWIKKFNDCGIIVLRVWCQWDSSVELIDTGKDQTMYMPDGTLKNEVLNILRNVLKDADDHGTVILLVLFSRESWRENIRLSDKASELAMAELAKSLKPYRNLVFHIWNEFNYRTVDYFKTIKQIDPDCIVTNSPGYAGDLGSLDDKSIFSNL